METNNKLRKALKQVKELNDLWFDTFTLPDGATSIHDEIENVISAALAEPVKNCEVGTVGQQDERFYAFCKRHFNEVGLCDKACPCRDFNMIGGACSIIWAQMPYEEGDEK